MRTTPPVFAETSIEIRPATPIELPRIELIFPMPRKWFDYIKRNEISVSHYLEGWITSITGKIFPHVPPNQIERARQLLAEFGLEADKAMNSSSTVRISMLIRRDIWELFLVLCEDVGESPMRIFMSWIARTIEYEKSLTPMARRNRRDRRAEADREDAALLARRRRLLPGH